MITILLFGILSALVVLFHFLIKLFLLPFVLLFGSFQPDKKNE